MNGSAKIFDDVFGKERADECLRIATRYEVEVEARPPKEVYFRGDDPHRCIVRAETLGSSGRKRNCVLVVVRLMGDGEDHYARGVIGLDRNGHDDGRRGARFAPLFLTVVMLVTPQIIVADKEAGDGTENGSHRSARLVFAIEGLGGSRNVAGPEAGGDVFGQFVGVQRHAGIESEEPARTLPPRA